MTRKVSIEACLRQVPVLHVSADLLNLHHVLTGGSIHGDQQGSHNACQERPDAGSRQKGDNRDPAITSACWLLSAIPWLRKAQREIIIIILGFYAV